MSYDVNLTADLGGLEPVNVGELDANYTYNTGLMLDEAVGVWLNDLHGRPGSEVAEILWRAIAIMEADPARFEALNPDNGWGDATGWREFLRRIAEACDAAPQARLYVS